MRDVRLKKTLDLRRAYCGGLSPSLRSLFHHIHPEYDYFCYRYQSRAALDLTSNYEEAWILSATGLASTNVAGWCRASKWVRQIIRKRRRSQVKSAMYKINQGEYDSILPTFKRDAQGWC